MTASEARKALGQGQATMADRERLYELGKAVRTEPEKPKEMLDEVECLDYDWCRLPHGSSAAIRSRPKALSLF